MTDMNRQESIFAMQPVLRQTLASGIAKDGSNLGKVAAAFHWEDPEYGFVSTKIGNRSGDKNSCASFYTGTSCVLMFSGGSGGGVMDMDPLKLPPRHTFTKVGLSGGRAHPYKISVGPYPSPRNVMPRDAPVFKAPLSCSILRRFELTVYIATAQGSSCTEEFWNFRKNVPQSGEPRKLKFVTLNFAKDTAALLPVIIK